MNVIVRQIGSLGWKRIFMIFLFVWLLILFFTVLPMISTHVSSADTKTAERLARALSELESLRKQNNELHELFKDIDIGGLKADEKEVLENFKARLTKADRSINNNQDFGYISQKEDPNLQYELYRRRIATNVQEFWTYIHTELLNIQNQVKYLAPELVQPINQVFDLGAQHKRSLLHDIRTLSEVDGYATWREKEANDLSNLVQLRIKYLQNPADCKSAKKLVCSLNKGCGYGCQLHHAVYCFMVAYGTERTLILKSKGWRYHKGGWDEVFKPISETCTRTYDESATSWPGRFLQEDQRLLRNGSDESNHKPPHKYKARILGTPETQVLLLPIIDSLSPRPPYLPLAIPEDLAPRISRLHGDPIVWWVAQFLKYLLRPQEKTAGFIQEAITNMGFKRPIVGVHVRRTDKVGTEASFHGIEEYMNAVDEYYNQLELKERVDKRRIYLASDDPKVIADAKTKYPQYEILGDSAIAKTASVQSRYSDSSLNGIILDIHMLSMSDYLVCTFSSQVCRVAYEIMQNYYPDAADKFKSLDDIYYYGGQNAHNRIAVLPHESQKPGELSMQVGDLVGVAGNHWNGFSKGRNLRTQQIGLYPSFKVKDKIETSRFPTYPEATEKRDEQNE